MIDIHPEIRKYWENKGKVIRSMTTILGDKDIIYYETGAYDYVTLTDSNVIAIYTHRSLFPSIVKHYSYQINHQLYDEAMALRLYKLLAFL